MGDEASNEELDPALDFYQLLGVERTATSAQIRASFKLLAQRFHPDLKPESERAEAEQVFKRIAEAYATLTDALLRARYDAKLVGAPDPGMSEADVFVARYLRALGVLFRNEHIFAERALLDDKVLHEIVSTNLKVSLQERVLAVWKLGAAPSNDSFEGSFESGKAVLTTMGIVFPFRTTKREQTGNVIRVSSYVYLRGVPFAGASRLVVKLNPADARHCQLVIEREDGTPLVAALRHAPLAKLTLAANAWGVPLVHERPPRTTRPTLHSVGFWLALVCSLFLVVAVAAGALSQRPGAAVRTGSWLSVSELLGWPIVLSTMLWARRYLRWNRDARIAIRTMPLYAPLKAVSASI